MALSYVIAYSQQGLSAAFLFYCYRESRFLFATAPSTQGRQTCLVILSSVILTNQSLTLNPILPSLLWVDFFIQKEQLECILSCLYLFKNLIFTVRTGYLFQAVLSCGMDFSRPISSFLATHPLTFDISAYYRLYRIESEQ